MKARPPPDWIELNAAAARLSGEWGLFPSEAERIVRKVALSGDVRIRATPQFESIFEFPKAERLDLVEGFLHSRAWRRLEIQWSELLEVGRDYSPYATPAPPKASTEDIREAIRAIINEWGYNPNTNELPPLVAGKAPQGHCVVQFVPPRILPPLFDPNVVQLVVVGAGSVGGGCAAGAETAARKLAAR